MAGRLDFGLLTGPASTAGLPPIPALRRRMQGLVVPETCGGKSQAFCGGEGMPTQELQQFLWQQFFSDPTQWRDYRGSKPTPRHPDFRHNKSKVVLWIDNRHKPAWVDSQLATWDAGMKGPPESVSTSVQGQTTFGKVAAHEEQLELDECRKLCEDGRMADAVDALDLLVQRGCRVDKNLFYLVLKRCTAHKDLVRGRRIHALTIESGYEGDAFLGTQLIGLYASNGRLEEAMRVFTNVSTPDAYNWATIIFAHARHGEAAEAIRLYRQMRELTTVKPTDHIYVAVLKACAAAGDLVSGKEVHAHILASPGKPNIFVPTGLIDMYAKCGSLDDARSLFDELPKKDVVSWNAMIAGYAQQERGQEALSLYKIMQEEGISPPNCVTFVCLLQACASVGVGALHQGKQLHAQIEERGLQDDVVLGGSLVNMYAKCGSLEEARQVFDRLLDRNVVTWNVMLAGYAQQGMGQEALSLYSSMQKQGIPPPDSATFVCLLQACAREGVGALAEGRKIHAQIEARDLQDDAVVGGSLVNMYAKCGSLEDARRVFDRLPDRSVVTWTALIAGYVEQGMGQEALSLYSTMQTEGISPPNSVTFVCLLQACASVGVGALQQGKQLHTQIQERGLQDAVVMGGSLVNMYAKCGSLEAARSVFDRLPQKNVVTWNAILAGYAEQGMGQEALSLYNTMQQEGLTPADSVTFVCLLQACASVGLGALQQGKQLHSQIEERGLQDDLVLGGSLVNMYAKCGSLEDARSMFDRLPDKDVVTWTALIAGYAQQGMGQEALSLYSSMQQEGITSPDSFTFACLLQACACVGVGLDQGKQLHAQIKERGLQNDVVLGGSLVNMYLKCSSLEDARSVFDRILDRDVVTVNSMIAAYSQQGMGQEALSLYSSIQQEGITTPNSVTFVCLLKACAIVAALPLGKQLHAQIGGQGLQADPVVGAALVNMYAKCGSMSDSQQVFDSLPERSIEAWGALIGGYTRQGDSEVVFDLLGRMRLEGIQPNGIVFLSVLTVCSHVGLVDKGRKYFEAMRTDYGISPAIEHYTCMMDLLGRAGHIDEALQMAKTMPFPPDGAVWLALLGACQKWKNIEIGQQAFDFAVSVDAKLATLDAGMETLPESVSISVQGKEAFGCLAAHEGDLEVGMFKQVCENGRIGDAVDALNLLVHRGSRVDKKFFYLVLKRCIADKDLVLGRQIHALTIKSGYEGNAFLATHLISLYATHGRLGEAMHVFTKVSTPTVYNWATIIFACTKHGEASQAIHLYRQMCESTVTPDNRIYVAVLKACATAGDLVAGKEVHGHILASQGKPDIFVQTGLIDMYAKCGSLEDARRVFDRLSQRDVVSWTAMIAGYAQQGMAQEALSLYTSMLQEGITPPDSVTFVCLLQACAMVAALPLGKQLHAQIEERGLQADPVVGAALVNMYAKCGSMFDSQQVFDSLPERIVEAWGALAGGYTRQGDSEAVFDLFDRMRQEGIQPNGIMFLSVLTVCSHVGLVDKGRKYFETMTTDYGISPTVDHYTCMMDLLGRAGHLDEVLQMAKSMPFPPDGPVWLTLLGACRKWKNVEIGKQAFDGAVGVDAKDSASYVLMRNIYASAQMWEEAKEIQERRVKSGAWKKPGQSWWTDMGGVVHTFVVGDKKHPESEGIYARLEQLVPKIKKEGYVPDLHSSLRDIPDEDKEAELCGHSEKLAIAYALNKTPEGTTIRVVKNLRVCVDCHTATAYISKVEKRTVICRDANRFHVFKDGKCSCGDYW